MNGLQRPLSPLQTQENKEKRLRWTSSAATHIGHVRKVNEDAFLDAREQRLWVVADGMGGHNAGDVASQTIIDQFLNFERGDDLSHNLGQLEKHLHEANQQCQRSAQNGVMGSTVALLFAQEPFCFVMWAGDSRVYRLREQKFTQLTEDHSQVWELFKQGKIREDEIRNHPYGNVITRAVGVQRKLNLDVEFVMVEPGDRFLICTDGLFRDLTESEIVYTLRTHSTAQAAEHLLQQALARGGKDNITAIVVQVESV